MYLRGVYSVIIWLLFRWLWYAECLAYPITVSERMVGFLERVTRAKDYWYTETVEMIKLENVSERFCELNDGNWVIFQSVALTAFPSKSGALFLPNFSTSIAHFIRRR